MSHYSELVLRNSIAGSLRSGTEQAPCSENGPGEKLVSISDESSEKKYSPVNLAEL